MRPSDLHVDGLVLESQREMDVAADSLRLFGGPGGIALAAQITDSSPMGQIRAIKDEYAAEVAKTHDTERGIMQQAEVARRLKGRMDKVPINGEMEVPYPQSALVINVLGRVASNGENLSGQRATLGLRWGAKALLRTFKIAQRVKSKR
jgi:hypothetical protein